MAWPGVKAAGAQTGGGKLDVRHAARVKTLVFKFLLVDNKKIKNDVSSTADTEVKPPPFKVMSN